MTDKSSEDLSDFRLIGGSIKLTERPSNSSSTSRRNNMTKFYSRPSSALPRLCNGILQEEFPSVKNDDRPYSADFIIPNLHSAKSKETLTDGSFESISVSVDLQLPSSNLFRELLEEDIEAWRRINEEKHENDKKETESDKASSIKTISNNSAHELELETQKRTSNIIESSPESHRSNEICNDQKYDTINVEKVNKEVSECQEEMTNFNFNTLSDFRYSLTPGLTSKPPLPKKTNQISSEPEVCYEQAIYDFFAIKYNMDQKKPQMLSGIAEKPIADIIPFGDVNENGYEADLTKKQEESDYFASKCIETTSVLEDLKDPEKDIDLNSTITDWLKEITSEPKQTDSETQTEQKQPEFSEFPLISEIDIEKLFEDKNTRLDLPETARVENSNKVDSSKKGNKGKEKKKKTTGSTTMGKVQLAAENVTEKVVVGKRMVAGNNTVNRMKFEAKPLRPAVFRSYASKEHEDVETWIGTQTKKKNSKGFDTLMDDVEDLKKTTELTNGQFPVEIVSFQEENCKSEQFDEIKTIIETLEHQDKASQNNIRTMKRIVSSELSNSIILNENEDNLSFRRNENKDIIKELTVTRVDQNVVLGNTKIRGEIESENTFSSGNLDENSTLLPNRKQQVDHLCPINNNNSKPLENASLHHFRDLVSYLDEVDSKCTKTLENAKERKQPASNLATESTSLFDTIPRVEDLLSYNPEELSSFIIDLSLRVKDKTSCIGLLQNELSNLRDKVLSQSKQADANLRQKMKEQKEETERIAKRHQKFIDQLMEEKRTLARRCEELVTEMTNMEDKYVANMKCIEHKHQLEMQKMKDMQAASEKLRRERWIEGRTQKIKEMAVKSIEPEVERMEKRHQEELSNLRGVHKREIEELELRAARKLQEHSEALRDQLIQDREKALSHERDIMRLRYEKLVESEERNYQEQRRRLLADYANRVAECEEREAQVVAEKERVIKQAQEEFEEKLQAAKRRHANELKLLKETSVIEIENWKNAFRKEQTSLLMEKETLIRKECRRERDKEIEMVIERLENESNKARSSLEETTENRIKRIKEKYDAEIKDLEMLERDAQNKYCDARAKLMEYEEVILTLRTSMRQLENQLTEQNVKCAKYESEREEIEEVTRREYEDKVRSLEREVEELRASADKQVEQLYSRVRVSLARKDEILEELTNDHKAMKEKCSYLENIIEQQRKEFLIH